MKNEDHVLNLNTIMVAFTAASPQACHDIGIVMAYVPEPTYQLINKNGESFHWHTNLCRPATMEEALDYWRSRALIAEGCKTIF